MPGQQWCLELSLEGGVPPDLRPPRARKTRTHPPIRKRIGPGRSRSKSSRWLPRLPSLTYSRCPMEPPFSSRSLAGFCDSHPIVTRQRDNANRNVARLPGEQLQTPLSLTRGRRRPGGLDQNGPGPAEPDGSRGFCRSCETVGLVVFMQTPAQRWIIVSCLL